MSSRIYCPHCKSSLDSSGHTPGHLVTCPDCHQQFQMPHPTGRYAMPAILTSEDSTGRIIAGLASFFIPGLGQLVQGRLGAAAAHCILAVVLWIITFGLLAWIMHVWSAYSAATYKPGR